MQADDHRTAALHSWQAGDVTGAIAQLRDGVRLTPGDSTLRITLAEYLWASYEFDEALQNYTLAADADPANSMLFVQVAQKLFSLGHFAPAVAWLEKASARAPADAAIRTMLGEVCERCDRLDHAERYAHEALGLDPAHPKAIR
jgi:Flp pilus assembly protein TadD